MKTPLQCLSPKHQRPHQGDKQVTVAKLPLFSLETILTEPPAPPDWLVDRLIGDGSRAIVFGEWGAFKSWGLLSLGLHIAAGAPWFGTFSIPKARRVLYIDEEMSQSTLRRRVQRLVAGMDYMPSKGMFSVLSRRGLRFDGKGVTDLVGDLKQSGFDPEVMIVETFRRVFPGNENDAKDVAEFWRSADPIILPGRTLIISHHMKKPNAKGGNAVKHRASGSTDIPGGADDALAFQRNGKDTFVVQPVKCREAEEAQAFVVSVEFLSEGAVRLNYEGTPAEFKAEGGKAAQAEQMIVCYLSDPAHKVATTAELIALGKTADISQSSVERALRHLRKNGRIDAPKTGVYQLSAGVEKLHPSAPPKGGDGEGGSPPPSLHLSIPALPSSTPSTTDVKDGQEASLAMFDTPCNAFPEELADAA